jgi:hypothetical protein
VIDVNSLSTKRKSLGEALEKDELKIMDVGKLFPFKNREKESETFFDLICQQEDVRRDCTTTCELFLYIELY